MNLPISIRGARQHNLRNLDLDLPSNKLIVRRRDGKALSK